MKLFGTILFFWITGTLSIFGQSDLLKGKLIDAQTIEPVAFATVAAKGRAVGVISNADGSFSVPERFKIYGDTLEVSSLGYEVRQILMSRLSVDKVRTIYLQPAVFELKEAIVKGNKKRRLSARQIVRRAIKNISKNYPQNPFSIVGYYRDYQLRENKFINLNEAIIEVYDAGFKQVDSATTKVQIYDYKRNTDFKRDTLADNPYDYLNREKVIDNAFLKDYGGNEFIILRVHDAIRNYGIDSFDFINTLAEDILRNHSFRKEPLTYDKDVALYTIKFKNTLPSAFSRGTLYISPNNFAIHKLEYKVFSDMRRFIKSDKGQKRPDVKLIFEVNTEYRRAFGKMYLNYISFHNNFEVTKPPKFTLDSTLVNAPGGYYMSYFNKPVDSISAKRKKNYDLIFNKKRFGIESIEVFQDSVKLYTDSSFKRAMANYRWEMGTLIRKGRSAEVEELFSLRVKNIRDVEGNLVNEPEIEDYQQFRELFVQEVKPNTHLPSDVLLMDKHKPIFKDQPISRPDNFDDYWMNTPLQKIGQQKTGRTSR
ncbi:MAG: carboxypeptidase-like regulatory domain-containing protein [Aurantibacter sp.]